MEYTNRKDTPQGVSFRMSEWNGYFFSTAIEPGPWT